MFFYIAPYIFLVALYFTGRALNVPYRLFFFAGCIPAFLLVCLRGNVGTDTASYIGILDNISLLSVGESLEGGGEYGFIFFSKVLLDAGLSSRMVLVVIATLVCLLFYMAFSNSIYSALIGVLLVYPIFFYDMSMNGLRYGIAFCLAKIAFDKFDVGKFKSFFLILLAISFHYTAILVYMGLLAKRLNIKYFFWAFILGGVFLSLTKNYLSVKFISYQDVYSPGGGAGLSLLLLSLLIYLASMLVFARDKLYLSSLFLLCALSFILAGYTYAGLRFQSLFLFVFICALPSLIERKNNISNLFFVAMFVVGFLGFLFRARNMMDGYGDSPFIPYHFIWDIK